MDEPPSRRTLDYAGRGRRKNWTVEIIAFAIFAAFFFAWILLIIQRIKWMQEVEGF
jgi:hypothetical protein